MNFCPLILCHLISDVFDQWQWLFTIKFKNESVEIVREENIVAVLVCAADTEPPNNPASESGTNTG